MERRISFIALCLAISGIFISLFPVFKGYAEDAGVSYIDLSVVPGWSFISQNAWYIGFGFLVFGLLIATGVIVWNIWGLYKWIKEKRSKSKTKTNQQSSEQADTSDKTVIAVANAITAVSDLLTAVIEKGKKKHD